jgi:Transposase DDE domain
MWLSNQPMQEKRLMARTNPARRVRPDARALVGSLRNFLTPALWKQAHQARGHRARPRWPVQPLALVLLTLTWACGDSLPERFEIARGFVAVCLPKRRRPGQTASGFQKALARLPMPVLRVLAAGFRRCLLQRLAVGWEVAGFVPLGCDGTRLECPRAQVLEQRLGQAGKQGSAPSVWLTALVHLPMGVPWAWRWGLGNASERGHLRQLLPLLPAAALLVADAGFVGYDLLATLLQRRVCFLIRMSCQATFYREGSGAPARFRDGAVYYWPPAKKKGSSQQAPLRLRLIRVRGQRRKHDVWLATNVLDPKRLSVAQAAQFYRMRWESEGLFRTYKRTLAKVKLQSRTVRLVHREAEGSLLATQLLLAQGALALQPRRGRAASGAKAEAARVCSPRQVLLAIREELRAAPPRRRQSFGRRLAAAQRERRQRRSLKAKRPWPQRTPHQPPKSPHLLTLGEKEKARIMQHETLIE